MTTFRSTHRSLFQPTPGPATDAALGATTGSATAVAADHAAAHAPGRAAPSRRRFIGLVGGGAVWAATAPLTGCSSAAPDSAVQAWQPAAPDMALRQWVLAHALLAPNPHNRQPWLADLRRDGEITLVCDPARLLPETDPFGRQILIGCGAFVELAVMAAAERGVRVEVQLFPAGAPALGALPGGQAVARLVLVPDAGTARDPLFAQVRQRRTHRGAFNSARVLNEAERAALLRQAAAPGQQAGLVVAAPAMATLRQITRDAFHTEVTTDRTYLESAHLMRIGSDEIGRHRDGISITGRLPVLLSALGLFDRFEVPRAGSSNLRHTMDHWAASETGSGYLWIASPPQSRPAELQAGRAWVRTQLQATALGLQMQPLSQALQEFAEVAPYHQAVHQALGLDPARQRLQMLARVGQAEQAAAAAPRRPLDTLLRSV